MKLVFANDSFKGSLSSKETALLLEKAAHFVFNNVETVKIPLSDGGKGLLDAVLSASGGRKETVRIHDPLMGIMEASYAVIRDKLAVIDATEACGIDLLSSSLRDTRYTSSYGIGELIRHAMDSGCEYIVTGTGELACEDGGIGALRALGARLLDESGKELEGRGSDVEKLAAIDLSELDDRITDISFTLMCDISNPLEGMDKYKEILHEITGLSCDNVTGTAAGGGFAAAAYSVLGAELRSGTDTMMGMIKFENRLDDADMVITGSNVADKYSSRIGIMQAAAKRASAAGIPVIALVGSLGDGWEEVLRCGVSRLFCITGEDDVMGDENVDAEELYYDAAVRLFENMKEGSL